MSSKKLFMLKLSTLLMSLVILGTAMACSSRITIPPLEKGPTPTVPPSYITFTDPLGLFNVSYPPTWEAPYIDKDLMTKVSEAKKTQSQGKIDGGLLTVSPLDYKGEGTSLSLTIWVNSFPIRPNFSFPPYSLQRSLSYEEYELLLKNDINNYKKDDHYNLRSVKRVLVGSLEGFLLDVQYKNDRRTIEMEVPEPKFLWMLSCSVALSNPGVEENIKTCEAVVRTFRILQ